MKSSSSTSAVTEGQVKNFRRLMTDANEKMVGVVLAKIDKDGMDRLLRRGNEMSKATLEAGISKARELSFAYGDQVSGWVAFYKKHFNRELDLTSLMIPDHQEGFDRLLVVDKDLTRNKAYHACEKQFPCSSYRDDLDNAIRPDERDPKNGTYAIWVRDRQEADQENKDQSWNRRREQKCQDENILERILHELKYFDETGKHLDIDNWTLTSSLSVDGSAVSAGWIYGEFCVYWSGPDDHGDDLRPRSVVSSS